MGRIYGPETLVKNRRKATLSNNPKVTTSYCMNLLKEMNLNILGRDKPLSILGRLPAARLGNGVKLQEMNLNILGRDKPLSILGRLPAARLGNGVKLQEMNLNILGRDKPLSILGRLPAARLGNRS